jgi:hypothetical protein
MKRFNRSRVVLASAALLLALGLVACDSAPESVLAPAGNAAAASMTANRGSWNNWHVHDLAPPAEPYTDANGLRHEDYNIWPVIWPDYPSDESPVVYCTDGAEKALVGGDGGSKLAAGTCRNELYIIHIQLNASDAPAPAEPSGWTALPLGNGFTLYYRLTPR